MKKTLLILASVTLLFSACSKKDDNNGGGVTGAASNLTTGKWIITSSTSIVQYPNPIGPKTIDLWATFTACQKDNQYIFNTNNTNTTDEGATRCNPSDPQQITGGTWSLSNNNTVLTLTDGSTTVVSNVLTLDNANLKLQYENTISGITAKTTTTYVKL